MVSRNGVLEKTESLEKTSECHYGSIMGWSEKTKKFLPLFIALFSFSIAGALGGIFLSRPPVLIITDASFLRLYGPERLKQKQRRISVALFRKVVPVTVSEIAGPDLVAIAAEEASPAPCAVLFPYRYLEAARIYRQGKPGTPVLVMEAPKPPEFAAEADNLEGEQAITFVCTDIELDLHRAGLAATLLAGEKKILIYDNGLFPEEHRESLREKLKDQGIVEEPVFLSSSSRDPSYSDIGCIVIAGPAFRFLDQEHNIPMVLFSWSDPFLTPKGVKVIFDDSSWALAAEAIKSVPSAGAVFLPSIPLVVMERIDKKENFRELLNLVKAR